MKALPFLLLAVVVVSSNSALPQTATAPSDNGFRDFLGSLQSVTTEAISSKKTEKLDGQLQAMQIANFQEWFASTFGPDNGSKMAASYSETLTAWEGRLRKAFTPYAEDGGQVTATAVYGGPEPQSTPIAGQIDGQIDKAIRESLKVPMGFELVQYTGKSSKSGYPYAISFGYATLVNGSYRVIPENVMRTLPNMPAMRVRQGGAVTAASLASRVQPVYPAEARKQQVNGTVRLHAVIGRDGAIQQLEVLSGDPLLVEASLDAVRQWRYRPTTLNGEPVEIDTTIDLIFALN